MGRQLDRDGQEVLARWTEHNDPDKDTRRLIAEAVRAYSGSPRQGRFFMEEDESNPGVYAIEPDAGLTIHVQEADPGEFTCLRVIDKRK